MKKLLSNKKSLIITISTLVILIAVITFALVVRNKRRNEEAEYLTPEEEWSTMMMEEGPTGAGEEYIEESFDEGFEEGFDGENMMMGNPWFDTEKEELEAILGMTFKLPKGAKNATYRMNLAIQMGEVNFDCEGLSYTARIQNTESYEDISGVYEEWTVADECDVNGAKGEIMRALHSDTDMVDVITWFDENEQRSYSLTTSGNLDGFDIEAVAEAMYP